MMWKDFADAVALFATKYDQINTLLRGSSRHQESIGDMRALGANTLVEATSNLLRRSKEGVVVERLKTLETLVSSLLAFEATNSPDIVYGVSSITKATAHPTSKFPYKCPIP